MAKIPVALHLRRAICQNIAEGIWPPGSVLPGREHLARQHRVSLRSLQQAIDDCIADGTLISHGGHGTVVGAQPPCLSRIQLLCPQEKGPGLAGSLLHAVAEHAAGEHFTIIDPLYLDRIVDDLRDYRCAGAIILGEVTHLREEDQQALAEAGPVVIIGYLSERFARLHLDLFASLRWALHHIREAGHHRIGVITASRSSPLLREKLLGWLEEEGAATDIRLLQELSPAAPHGADSLIPLWWSMPAAERPEAILIADDHLVPAVTTALARLDLSDHKPYLLAHANYPKPSGSATPAVRYGFRAQDVLGNCLELIHQAGLGTSNPVRTLLPMILKT